MADFLLHRGCPGVGLVFANQPAGWRKSTRSRTSSGDYLAGPGRVCMRMREVLHDLIAGYLLHASQGLTSGTIQFGALYLLSHGLVKVVLVAGLLLRRYWAYPAAILIFLFFLIYQLYRWTHTHAPELILLSVIDVFVILLTWAEYRRLQGIHGFRKS